MGVCSFQIIPFILLETNPKIRVAGRLKTPLARTDRHARQNLGSNYIQFWRINLNLEGIPKLWFGKTIKWSFRIVLGNWITGRTFLNNLNKKAVGQSVLFIILTLIVFRISSVQIRKYFIIIVLAGTNILCNLYSIQHLNKTWS